MIPVVRTEITHAVDNTWTDVDVSAYVNPGHTAGVMLEIVNTTNTEYTWGVRKNGSTDDIKAVIEDTGHTYAAIGVDTDDIFELYLSDASEVDVYIVGYIDEADGTFLTNTTEKTLVNTFTWEDVDISGDTTGTDKALVAFFLITNTGATFRRYGLRKNGSTDDHWGRIFDGDLRGAMMAVDGNEILECYSENVDDVNFYLVGWLIDNVVSFANGIDKTAAGAAAWEDVDFSANIPGDWNGAFWHFHVQNVEYAGGIRKDGDLYDNYYDFTEDQHGWVEISQARLAEQEVENTNLKLYLWGYTRQRVPRMPAAFNDFTVY